METRETPRVMWALITLLIRATGTVAEAMVSATTGGLVGPIPSQIGGPGRLSGNKPAVVPTVVRILRLVILSGNASRNRKATIDVLLESRDDTRPRLDTRLNRCLSGVAMVEATILGSVFGQSAIIRTAGQLILGSVEMGRV